MRGDGNLEKLCWIFPVEYTTGGCCGAVYGKWHLAKPAALPKTLTYPAGFDVARNVVGNTCTPPADGQRAFASLAGANYNVWLRLSGPDMSTLAALTLVWFPEGEIMEHGVVS